MAPVLSHPLGRWPLSVSSERLTHLPRQRGGGPPGRLAQADNIPRGRRGMAGEPASHPIARRQLIAIVAAPFVLTCLPWRPAEAALGERSLALHHVCTGERLEVVYYKDGCYVPVALAGIAHHLRDWRAGKAHPIDHRLLDLMWVLRGQLDPTVPIEVTCGYRTPETNALLLQRHHGVSRHSLHMRGMAVDLRIPSCGLRLLRAAAIELKAGGVGYYPAQNFVHLDTGPVRHW
jgi:uncharacterized protein YcbK (DUF882 family)